MKNYLMSFNTATLLRRNCVKNVVLIASISLLLVCKFDNPKEWSGVPASQTKVTVSQDSINAKTFDSLLTNINDIENELFCSQSSDLKQIKKLVNRTFDTSNGCFHTVGKGIINPSFPPETQNASRKNAAKYKGEQWALTLKSWYTGKKLPVCTHASGQIFYSKILFNKLIDDTLLMLLEVPLGSINVQDLDTLSTKASGTIKKRILPK
jgi:hypothetical protein